MEYLLFIDRVYCQKFSLEELFPVLQHLVKLKNLVKTKFVQTMLLCRLFEQIVLSLTNALYLPKQFRKEYFCQSKRTVQNIFLRCILSREAIQLSKKERNDFLWQLQTFTIFGIIFSKEIFSFRAVIKLLLRIFCSYQSMGIKNPIFH